MIIQVISFILFTAFVAVIAYKKTNEGNLTTNDGYFLGGRSLTGVVIAGSLLLTNLSSEQLVGTNGQAYASGATVSAYEVTSGIALVVMGLYFLPKFLNMGITTIPEFLEDRFDAGVRNLITALFLISIAFITIPTVLYSGSLAFISLFDLQNLTGLSEISLLYIICFGIALVGSIYAIFGGLKAVAVSDLVNGIGLLIGGLTIPILGFLAVGDGNLLEGINTVIVQNPEQINLVGTSSDPVPFGSIFTGIILINIFYWCTNQSIIQRTLGAVNLAEGQKGVLYAGFIKILVPLMLVVPGVIAFTLYGDSLANPDMAYTTLVADVLPAPLLGIFAAVMFGAILSSFNSCLNSASTMFSINIYKPMIRQNASDTELIKVGKYFGFALAVASVILAPQISNAPNGLFEFMQQFLSFFNVPTLAVILIAFKTKRVPPIAAKVAIASYMILYGLITFVWQWEMNFLYIVGILFVLVILLMLAFGKFMPQEPYETKYVKAPVDMTPWPYAKLFSGIIVVTCCFVYLLFSPIGLAHEGVQVLPTTLTIGILYAITLGGTYFIFRPKEA